MEQVSIGVLSWPVDDDKLTGTGVKKTWIPVPASRNLLNFSAMVCDVVVVHEQLYPSHARTGRSVI